MAEFDKVGPSLETESHTGQVTKSLGGEPSTAATSDGVGPVPAVEESAPVAGESASVVEEPSTAGDAQTTGGAALPPEDSALPEAEEPEAATDPLDGVKEQLSQILSETEKYNTRAKQREGVIDSMHEELERLRRGERRSLLRPLVSEVCRLRDDILRQADTLPEIFDANNAADLLRSYADSLEFALEDNGVSSYAPEAGDTYEARLHRASGRTPTTDARLAGKIATVVSPGYRDVEAETIIAAARVTVFTLDESAPAATQTAETATPEVPAPGEAGAPTATDTDHAAESTRPFEGEVL